MSEVIDPRDYAEDVGTVSTYDIGRVTRREIRRYARAVEDENPLFHDVSYARAQGYDDLVVPPNYLSAIIDPSEGRPHGELREDGLDPTQFPFRMPEIAVLMGGGQELTFRRYVVAGEFVRVEETFENLYQKESESMGTLTFLERTSEFFAGIVDPGEDVAETDLERAIYCEETTIIGDRL